MYCEVVVRVSLTLVDESMPRTVYFERFRESLKKNRRFTETESEAAKQVAPIDLRRSVLAARSVGRPAIEGT